MRPAVVKSLPTPGIEHLEIMHDSQIPKLLSQYKTTGRKKQEKNSFNCYKRDRSRTVSAMIMMTKLKVPTSEELYVIEFRCRQDTCN
jgi:hypothetical protein